MKISDRFGKNQRSGAQGGVAVQKFYLKQKVFSFTDRYKVYDENQNVAYHCEGHFLSFTHRMDFFETAANRHLFTIKKRLFTFLPVYLLTDASGKTVAIVRKRFTLLKHKLEIESDYGHYTIEGDYFAHTFTIFADGGPLVDVRKKWLSWGDSYEIEITSDNNVGFFVALVVMIDNCLHDNSQQSSGIHIGAGR